jgi:hypothetical protein
MGSKENSLRIKWQHYSGYKSNTAELNFLDAFELFFEETEFVIRKKPKEFCNIYLDVQLAKIELDKIYTPNNPIKKHGILPDYAIDNKKTGKTIYIEVKSQDGWIEGKKRADGRGNAHERSCKFFTPGLLKVLREKGGIKEDSLPFWVIFQGDITRDPCRVKEITHWYDDKKEHFFFWRDTKDPTLMFEHFIKYIEPLLN